MTWNGWPGGVGAGASVAVIEPTRKNVAKQWEDTMQRMKHLKTLAILTAAGCAAALFGPEEVRADVLKLRLSVESTPGAATQHMLASFRDYLKGELGDQVEIEFFDSGTLGDEIVHMEQVRTGQLDVIPIGSDAVALDSK